MINGQLAPDAGEILLAARNIAGLPPRAIWRLGVGRTFQIAATFGSMTVVENVQMALISHAGETYPLWRPAADAPSRARARAAAQVGMQRGRRPRLQASSPTATSSASNSRSRSPTSRACC